MGRWSDSSTSREQRRLVVRHRQGQRNARALCLLKEDYVVFQTGKDHLNDGEIGFGEAVYVPR